MSSADWYFAQADLLRGRADACLQLAGRLDGAALFDLHQLLRRGDVAGPGWRSSSTTSCGVHCARLQDAIDRLRVNALGLSGDADDLERTAPSSSTCALRQRERR